MDQTMTTYNSFFQDLYGSLWFYSPQQAFFFSGLLITVVHFVKNFGVAYYTLSWSEHILYTNHKKSQSYCQQYIAYTFEFRNSQVCMCAFDAYIRPTVE